MTKQPNIQNSLKLYKIRPQGLVLSELEIISFPQTIVNFAISIVTVITVVVSVFKWKWNQAMASQKFQMVSQNDIKKLTSELASLCKRFDELKTQLNSELVAAKEEHAEMQAKYQELIKELYQLVGKVTVMSEKSNNNG